MEKYGNKSPFMKIIHRYTGVIVLGIILAALIPLLLLMQSEQMFFERWSCSLINQYKVGVIVPNLPKYVDLTGEELEKFEIIWSQCQ
jgi:hypothetical protein